jgi:hypothetical protein
MSNTIHLLKLLAYFGDNKTQASKVIGVHYQTVIGWTQRGQVGKKAALMIDANPNVPFTKEQLRPDLF